MSNYVPHYTKKQAILERREDDLRRLLSECESKLLDAAEEVKLARIRALRAAQAKISPADVPKLREEIAKLDVRIKAVAATSKHDVLLEFLRKHRWQK